MSDTTVSVEFAFCSVSVVSMAAERSACVAEAGTVIPATASPVANNIAAICLFFIRSFSSVKTFICKKK